MQQSTSVTRILVPYKSQYLPALSTKGGAIRIALPGSTRVVGAIFIVQDSLCSMHGICYFATVDSISETKSMIV